MEEVTDMGKREDEFIAITDMEEKEDRPVIATDNGEELNVKSAPSIVGEMSENDFGNHLTRNDHIDQEKVSRVTGNTRMPVKDGPERLQRVWVLSNRTKTHGENAKLSKKKRHV